MPGGHHAPDPVPCHVASETCPFGSICTSYKPCLASLCSISLQNHGEEVFHIHLLLLGEDPSVWGGQGSDFRSSPSLRCFFLSGHFWHQTVPGDPPGSPSSTFASSSGGGLSPAVTAEFPVASKASRGSLGLAESRRPRPEDPGTHFYCKAHGHGSRGSGAS